MKRSVFKVTHVGDIRRGTSQRTGEDWQAQDIVLEEMNDETPFSESIATSLQNKDVDLGLREGERIECSPFIRVREYNGKFYNEVRVKNITPMRGQEVRPFGY